MTVKDILSLFHSKNIIITDYSDKEIFIGFQNDCPPFITERKVDGLSYDKYFDCFVIRLDEK